MEYQILDHDDYTEVRATGSVGMKDLLTITDELLRTRTNLFRRLWDLSDAHVTLTHDQAMQLAKIFKQLDSSPARTAVVASSDLAYGIARTHEAYRSTAEVRQASFRSREEALAWLLS